MPAPAASDGRENVLARTRAVLAATALVAIRLDPTEPARYAGLAYGLLVGYVAWSALLLLALRGERPHAPRYPLAVHAIDIAWATALSLFTDGPNSPFFLFFAFVLAAAAYRWGLRGAALTSAVLTVVLLGEAAVLAGSNPWNARPLMEGEFEVNRLVMRAIYLVIVAYLFGNLSEWERRAQRETAVVTEMLVCLRGERGVNATLQAVSGVLLRHFRARRLLVVLKDTDTGRAYLFDAGTGELRPRPAAAEIPPDRQALYLLVEDVPREFALHARRDGGVVVDGIVAPERQAVLQQALDPPPPELADDWRSLLVASAPMGSGWSGLVFVVDAAAPGRWPEHLRALQRFLHEVGPAVDNAYLLRQWRQRAGAVERARIARDLHDGVLQGLIGLEMQVDVLRRQAQERAAASAGALTHVQAHLRHEIITVRELMQQMTPSDAGPAELLEHLSVIIDKFGRETGIAARFVADVERITMPPKLCRELVKIVQEALANVRRHSAAANVVVSLRRGDPGWLLIVDDDGQGFEFAGRLSHQQLVSSRKGPIIIRERVRSLGGELVVESRPPHGSRLEITLPEGIVG